MRNDSPNRELIERAEDFILRLRDIHSCRISTDETGTVAEVHVVATTSRAPKMIARDVETCLKAEMNLDVDYRKIGVVIIDPMKETDPVKRDVPSAMEADGDDTDSIIDERLFEAAIEAADFPSAVLNDPPTAVPALDEPDVAAPPSGDPAINLDFLEVDMRIRFAGLRISIEETRVDAEVKLEKNGLEVVGCLGGNRTGGPIYETIAGAAIHALAELLDEDFHLCLSFVEEIEISGGSAMLAFVDSIDGRMVRRFAGCVIVGRDPNEAAVLAVLDAVNRPSGRWKSRTEIHYHIR